ncbi:MAG TPA: putative PEP-binding protein, partial [Cryptosporangiaceae bacterium]|nr:putative PEP-binding protein [Cryptosporangiaceae bacterium]
MAVSVPEPMPGLLADRQPITLLASIGGPGEVPRALAAGAEGVGLLRTEFAFAGRHTLPSVAEQRHAYAEIFEAFGERRVVVQVLDAGRGTAVPC